MLNRLITFFLFIHFIITAIIFFTFALLIWVLSFPFDRKRKILHLFTSFWGSYYIYTFPAWKVKIEGKDKIDENQTYVYISNHQSLLDILVYFRLYRHFKWVSKEEIFKIPLVGWNMKMNQYVSVKRGFRKSFVKMMKDCMNHLSNGNSIFIFPEGSRSEDGEIKPFQGGAFVLAKNAKVSILPMLISGTRDALPKKRLKFTGRQNIRVKILDPVSYSEIQNLDDEKIISQIRDKMIYDYNELRKKA